MSNKEVWIEKMLLIIIENKTQFKNHSVILNWPGSRQGQYIVKKTLHVKTWICICTEINQWLKLNKSSAGNSTIVKSQFSSWYPKVSLCKWAIQIVVYSIFWLSCHICRAGMAEYVLFWVGSTENRGVLSIRLWEFKNIY